LQGYRLPTAAEMEYAIRAGAVTSRFFGETEDLLPKYSWYMKNAQQLTWPVGILKPNDFGLFDVQGNVFNWCQERWRTAPRAASDDLEDLALDVEPKRHRKIRGASFASRVPQVRSASGYFLEPEDDITYNGIRVARTISTTLPLTSPKRAHDQGGTIVLDKKDSLTEKDSGWIPSNLKGDPTLKLISGNPHKVYTLKLMKGDKILIRLKSADKKIDPVVALEDSRNNLMAYNDDEDNANRILDSKLVVTIPEDGEYRIIATCFSHEVIPNKHGDFHLTVEKTK
jgi:hypothetical protein